MTPKSRQRLVQDKDTPRSVGLKDASLSALPCVVGSLLAVSLLGLGPFARAESATPPAALTFSVSPARSMLIPGHFTTCTEYDVAPTKSSDGSTNGDGSGTSPLKKANSSRLLDRPPAFGGLRFPKFTLDYPGPGQLRLSYAIIHVTLPDQEFEMTLDDVELVNLLALPDLKIAGKTHIVSNDVTDPRRQLPSPFAPCGLVLNGIPLTNPWVGFVAPVEIRLSGYNTDANGNDTAVEVSTQVEVEYAP